MKLHRRGDETMEETPGEIQEQSQEEKGKKGQRPVVVYMAILFAAAFLLILLSYFIQQRRNSDTISSITSQHSQFSVQALENIEALQNTNLELQAQNAQLEEQAQELQERLDALEDELRQARSDWAAEAEAQRTQTQEQLAERESRARAAEGLLSLYMVVSGGDEASIQAALAAMEQYVPYLDGAYTELYQSILEDINN